MDAASDSGVDDVREKIVDVVSYAPMMGKYKVFIIDEVHDLSPKAFDALLKTVEEPPTHMIFILATTEFNKVPATIRSRCQKYEFHRATLKHLVDRLNFVCGSEGVTAEPAAVAAIARMADGGFRDALTLLEQAIIVSDGPSRLWTRYWRRSRKVRLLELSRYCRISHAPDVILGLCSSRCCTVWVISRESHIKCPQMSSTRQESRQCMN
jgi:DNA polymerase III delta prime subunit